MEGGWASKGLRSLSLCSPPSSGASCSASSDGSRRKTGERCRRCLTRSWVGKPIGGVQSFQALPLRWEGEPPASRPEGGVPIGVGAKRPSTWEGRALRGLSGLTKIGLRPDGVGPSPKTPSRLGLDWEGEAPAEPRAFQAIIPAGGPRSCAAWEGEPLASRPEGGHSTVSGAKRPSTRGVSPLILPRGA